jgi:hypothetical protein
MLHPRSATHLQEPSSPCTSIVPSAASWSVWVVNFAHLIRTWNRRRIFKFLFVLAFIAAGCTLTPDMYVADTVQNAPDAEVVIVEGRTAGIHKIDGTSLEHPNPEMYYASARLHPGQHSVTLYREFVVSVLIVSGGFFEAIKTYNVNLEAGHVYELHADRTTGPGFRVAMWVIDATAGKIVAGRELN